MTTPTSESIPPLPPPQPPPPIGMRGRNFIVHYLGAAMMDSRCVYHPKMMPWIIAEILRFSDNKSTVLMVNDSSVTVSCLQTERQLFESHIWDCVREFPVISDVEDGRHYFALIFKTNDVYLHCRLFASSNDSQVSEILSTMKDSSKNCTGSGPLPSSSPNLQSLASLSSEALSFEVLYMGKLRMSCRKAPVTFIDDAIEKFQAHEHERTLMKERRDNVFDESRRSSSQEDSSGSTDNLSALPFIRPIHQIHKEKDSDEWTDKAPHLWPPNITTTTTTTTNLDESYNYSSKDGAIVSKPSFSHPLEDVTYVQMKQQQQQQQQHQQHRFRTPSGDSCLVKSLSLPVEPMRSRALSTGHEPRSAQAQVLDIPKSDSSQSNRTMILLIGKNEMRIISPDAKTTLFSKNFRDIYHSAKGIKNGECFGFICRESGNTIGQAFVAYVFSCQSESVTTDILQVLKQAFMTTQERKERQLSCEHCPMSWYCRLCLEVDGLSDERTHGHILKRIENLTEEDRSSIMAKFHGAEPQSMAEQNELLMMLLRAHCESKQTKHTHDTTENRHEFLHHYLGGGAIFMKAKRSLTNSFDQFVKKKTSGSVLPSSGTTTNLQSQSSIPSTSFSRINIKENSPPIHSSSDYNSTSDLIVSDSPLGKGLRQRPRSSTIGVLSGEKIRCEIRSRRGEGVVSSSIPPQPSNLPTIPTGQSSYVPMRSGSISRIGSALEPSTHTDMRQHSPMMNIFMKVGPGTGSKMSGSSGSGGGNNSNNGSSSQILRRQGSWRQAIFKRVVSPSSTTPSSENRISPNLSPMPHGLSPDRFRPKKTSEDIRNLWKTAIRQQILLIRMEKQNYMLKEKQEEVNVKRNKLGYKELGICDLEANDTWDLIITQAQYTPTTKCDIQLLNSALLRGIPKHKRGQVWQLFIQQRRLSSSPSNNRNDDYTTTVQSTMTYEQLLRNLTSHQHAILIDLGRTFPNHQFFSSPLGSGQLSLFNLLKAYSLLDPDVGYCQGLSFVAGLLLMHLEEEEAFGVLKYLMFELGAREHYKPDMLGLQVKMYQLTRLIHDQDSDIHLLLYHNDVFPSLYAAPWFLTMFASQFPTGFAVRVVDMVMLHGVDVIAKFALALILDNKKELMECSGLEQVMECFKHVVTNVTSERLDKYLRKVIDMDSDKQLLTYAVEYSVMHDETFLAFLNEANCPSSNRGKSGTTMYDKSIQTVPMLSSLPHERQSIDNMDIGESEKSILENQVMNLWEHVTKVERLLLKTGQTIPQRAGNVTEGALLKYYSCFRNGQSQSQGTTTTTTTTIKPMNGSCDRISSSRLIRSHTLDGDDDCSSSGMSQYGSMMCSGDTSQVDQNKRWQ